MKVPPEIRSRVAKRIERYAEEHYVGRYTRLGIRFRGQFCYTDAFTEPDEPARADPNYPSFGGHCQT